MPRSICDMKTVQHDNTDNLLRIKRNWYQLFCLEYCHLMNKGKVCPDQRLSSILLHPISIEPFWILAVRNRIFLVNKLVMFTEAHTYNCMLWKGKNKEILKTYKHSLIADISNYIFYKNTNKNINIIQNVPFIIN